MTGGDSVYFLMGAIHSPNQPMEDGIRSRIRPTQARDGADGSVRDSLGQRQSEGGAMRIASRRGWLGTVGLAVIVGCSSEATGLADYFTFLLDGSSLGGFAYVYIPWGAEPVSEVPPNCWLIGFDLKGRALLDVAGDLTEDEQDQQKGPTPETGTYAQYLGNEDGALSELCISTLDARFTFGGSAYRVTTTLRRGFGNPKSLIPEEQAYGLGTWMLEGSSDLGDAAFWPYELRDVGANAVRLYLTEPAHR